jgi:hypothetical protein
MRKPEQRFWDRLGPNLRQGGNLRIERVENAVGDGFPDTIVICEGVVTPCELKAVEEPPARLSTPLIPSGKGLNQDQKNWHAEWRRHGGHSLIIIGLGSRQMFCLPGGFADFVNKMSLADMAANSVAGNYAELREYLRKPK